VILWSFDNKSWFWTSVTFGLHINGLF
jgi:hypothetical protein